MRPGKLPGLQLEVTNLQYFCSRDKWVSVQGMQGTQGLALLLLLLLLPLVLWQWGLLDNVVGSK